MTYSALIMKIDHVHTGTTHSSCATKVRCTLKYAGKDYKSLALECPTTNDILKSHVIIEFLRQMCFSKI